MQKENDTSRPNIPRGTGETLDRFLHGSLGQWFVALPVSPAQKSAVGCR